MLKEYDDTKENRKSLKTSTVHQRLSYCLKCRKNTESKNAKFAKTKKEKLIYWFFW